MNQKLSINPKYSKKLENYSPQLKKKTLAMDDLSMLHIIILDDIDAICKQRGSVKDGTPVYPIPL